MAIEWLNSDANKDVAMVDQVNNDVAMDSDNEQGMENFFDSDDDIGNENEQGKKNEQGKDNELGFDVISEHEQGSEHEDGSEHEQGSEHEDGSDYEQGSEHEETEQVIEDEEHVVEEVEVPMDGFRFNVDSDESGVIQILMKVILGMIVIMLGNRYLGN